MTNEAFSLKDAWIPKPYAAKLLGVCRQTVNRLINRGLIKAWYYSKNCTLVETNSVLDYYERTKNN